jgi:hypothetical protein
VIEIIAAKLGGSADGSADIAGRVAMEDGLGQERRECLRQIVAQGFKLGAERFAVEAEAGIVFEVAQRFAGAVGVCVENAKDLRIH